MVGYPFNCYCKLLISKVFMTRNLYISYGITTEDELIIACYHEKVQSVSNGYYYLKQRGRNLEGIFTETYTAMYSKHNVINSFEASVVQSALDKKVRSQPPALFWEKDANSEIENERLNLAPA